MGRESPGKDVGHAVMGRWLDGRTARMGDTPQEIVCATINYPGPETNRLRFAGN